MEDTITKPKEYCGICGNPSWKCICNTTYIKIGSEFSFLPAINYLVSFGTNYEKTKNKS